MGSRRHYGSLCKSQITISHSSRCIFTGYVSVLYDNRLNTRSNKQWESTEILEMIGSVPDKVLDNNGLYMRLKLINNEKNTVALAQSFWFVPFSFSIIIVLTVCELVTPHGPGHGSGHFPRPGDRFDSCVESGDWVEVDPGDGHRPHGFEEWQRAELSLPSTPRSRARSSCERRSSPPSSPQMRRWKTLLASTGSASST
jgi:hypothetical protein